jgi:hypothetical protein
MTSWAAVSRDAEGRHHVASVTRAAELGLGPSSFYEGAARAGWSKLFPGTRVAPGKAGDLKTILVAVTDSAPLAAASERTAAWLHGLVLRPPQRLEVVIPHGRSARKHDRVGFRRARWIDPERDVVEVDAIPTLGGSALALTWASLEGAELRTLLIDAAHRGIVDLGALEARIAGLGSFPGRERLRRLAVELAQSRMESGFEDDVRRDLTRRGYDPAPGPTPIATPDGKGLTVDIALPWYVAVEPEGDRFHRTREQRRTDRRRLAQYAGTPWVPVPVDWRDWQLEPDRVRAAIDAAVLSQHRAGWGREVPLPPHLRGRG